MSARTNLGNGASKQVAWGVAGAALASLWLGACAPMGRSPASAATAEQANGASSAPPLQSSPSAPDPSLMKQMLAPGSEAAGLARLVGSWNVTMTMRPAPDAPPVVVDGMVAERVMVGLYLTETMTPAPGSKLPDFKRVDYLTYDKVQSRWEYVSLDTRAPIGIMFAKSYAGESGPEITVYFDNFFNPGVGPVGAGVRARHVDTREGDDHAFKRQYWTSANTPEWLAIQYEYVRRR